MRTGYNVIYVVCTCCILSLQRVFITHPLCTFELKYNMFLESKEGLSHVLADSTTDNMSASCKQITYRMAFEHQLGLNSVILAWEFVSSG